jgi:hypothetical protein
MKNLFLGFALLVVSFNVFAADINGTVSRGAPYIFHVTCDPGTTLLRISVADRAPVLAPYVWIQAFKPGDTGNTTHDPVDGDGAFGWSVHAAMSAYVVGTVVVSTTSGGATENFTGRVICQKIQNNQYVNVGVTHVLP